GSENVTLAGRTAVDVSVRGVSFSPILYDAIRRGLAHRPEAYSPSCLEEEFSEVGMQDAAWPRSLATIWSA
ncbi:MAG TPA: hypothetical protein VK902_23775, partial [Rubrobacter sp.]|nr:hypothetical protein [Rubrobacter sp.]